MSEESKRSYSAREIVLEFFPATHQRLIPKPRQFRLDRSSTGQVLIRDRVEDTVLSTLEAVESSGPPSTQLCCDLCGWTGTRDHVQFLRAEIPGSGGRRFRYVAACLMTEDCDARRLDDESVRQILRLG